jgi:hypothetical protein
MSFLRPGLSYQSPFPSTQVADQGHPVVSQALQQYPILQSLGLQSVPGSAGGNVLEFWAPGEPGTQDAPRPKGLHIDSPGIEVGPNAKPLDILGDVVSHHLINTDPTIKSIYSSFSNSLTRRQNEMLQGQYEHAQKNEGETRGFDEWKKSSGLPAFFRGYPFQQWPDDFNQVAYTPQQRQLLDKMMGYLSK